MDKITTFVNNEYKYLVITVIVVVVIVMVLLIWIISGIRHYRKYSRYDRDGFNSLGFDRQGYDRSGYNKKGYDRQGYDRNGYNKKGYDQQGYDRSGYDRGGFNKSGFNKDGFDRFGFNKNGYNRYGFDRFGFDRNGFTSDGYNRRGYNKEGIDKSGFSANDYQKIIHEMKTLHNKTYEQMKKCAYGYALHDIRIGLEKGVKCVISHLMGIPNMNSSLDDNITICKNYGLLERDFVEKLYDAKNHCNDAQHDSNIKKEYNQVFFSYKVLEELIEAVQTICL